MRLSCSLCCGADTRPTHIENVKDVPVISSFKAVNIAATAPPSYELVYPVGEQENEPVKESVEQAKVPVDDFEPFLETSSRAQDGADLEFDVTLVRDNYEDRQFVEVTPCASGRALLVMKVNSGPIQTWNLQNNEKVHVRHLDSIVKVDDVTGDAFALREAMLAEWKMLNIMIVRPREFRVHLVKGPTGDSAKLGLDISQSALQSLHVKRVKKGLTTEWNKKFPSLSVQVGDRIIEINGSRGNSAKLLSIVKSESELEMVVCRIA
eukprot:TRINITY_DN15824_c0_g2_i1.p1 TRINITY_DN15824_c0_g2~~TRINITY_DN15824_c0_g2_i1.p1  ORF type:complete len:265 (+),score=55.22 TRINITY_DN15824_c0_g2_i1:86-880(+)